MEKSFILSIQKAVSTPFTHSTPNQWCKPCRSFLYLETSLLSHNSCQRFLCLHCCPITIWSCLLFLIMQTASTRIRVRPIYPARTSTIRDNSTRQMMRSFGFFRKYRKSSTMPATASASRRTAVPSVMCLSPSYRGYPLRVACRSYRWTSAAHPNISGVVLPH